MNSVLFREQGRQFENNEPFCNFQESLSNSTFNSNEASYTDNNYWINYYNSQKNKEKDEKKYSNHIKFLKYNKQLSTSPNANRKLIFSMPFKKKDSNHINNNIHNKIKVKTEFQKNAENNNNNMIRSSSEIIIINRKSSELIIPDAIEIQNDIQTDSAMITPQLSSKNLPSMSSKLNKNSSSQENQITSQNQLTESNNQQTQLSNSISSSIQTNPSKTMQYFSYNKTNKIPFRSSGSSIISSSENIKSTNNFNNISNQQQQFLQLQNYQPQQYQISQQQQYLISQSQLYQQYLTSQQQQYLQQQQQQQNQYQTLPSQLSQESQSQLLQVDQQQKNNDKQPEDEINRKTYFEQPKQQQQQQLNKTQLQCFHINRLKNSDSQLGLDLQKTIFSKSKGLLINNKQQYSSQQSFNQQNNINQQNIRQTTSIPIVSSQFTSTTQFPTHKNLGQTIQDFQQSKILTSMKYQTFLQVINYQSQNRFSFHSHNNNNQSTDQQNLQRTELQNNFIAQALNSRNDSPQITSNQTRINNTNQFNNKTIHTKNINENQETLNKQHKDAFIELLYKDRQSENINNINDNFITQQSYSKQLQNCNLNQNQSTQQTIPLEEQNNIYQETNNNNLITENSKKIRCNSSNGNRYGTKRINSANPYSRKQFQNNSKELTNLQGRKLITQSQETQISQLGSNIKEGSTLNGFNLLQGISTLNINNYNNNNNNININNKSTLLQKSSLTPTHSIYPTQSQQQQSRTLFSSQSHSQPKLQKNFSVLYKICNKNILNVGMKQPKKQLI